MVDVLDVEGGDAEVVVGFELGTSAEAVGVGCAKVIDGDEVVVESPGKVAPSVVTTVNR
jgi:hypothetical protein